MPEPLRLLLASPARQGAEWRAPVDVPAELLPAIASARDAVAAQLQPIGIDQLMTRVEVLLSHWRAAEHSDAVWAELMADWYDSLLPYPAWAVQQACRDYVREEVQPPKVAAIVRRVEALVAPLRQADWRLGKLQDPARRPPWEREAARRAAADREAAAAAQAAPVDVQACVQQAVRNLRAGS